MYDPIDMCCLSCLQLESNTSQRSIARTLDELKEYLTKVKKATEVGGPYDTFTHREDMERRISSNLQRFVRATESFHSNASTLDGGARTVIRESSVMGTPLNPDELRQIHNWIPTIEEVEEPQAAEGELNRSSPETSSKNILTPPQNLSRRDLRHQPAA